jgi:hypothetical protein
MWHMLVHWTTRCLLSWLWSHWPLLVITHVISVIHPLWVWSLVISELTLHELEKLLDCLEYFWLLGDLVD